MRTRMPPNSRVRHVAVPVSPGWTVGSTPAHSVVPNGTLAICTGRPCRAPRLRALWRFAQGRPDAIARLEILQRLLRGLELVHRAVGLAHREDVLGRVDLDDLPVDLLLRHHASLRVTR